MSKDFVICKKICLYSLDFSKVLIYNVFIRLYLATLHNQIGYKGKSI